MLLRTCFRLFALAGLTACAVESVAAAAPIHLAVTARFAIGGTDVGYDFLRFDGASNRLFVAHGIYRPLCQANRPDGLLSDSREFGDLR